MEGGEKEDSLHRSERPLRELFDQLRTTLKKICEYSLGPIENKVRLAFTVTPRFPHALERDYVPFPLMLLWQLQRVPVKTLRVRLGRIVWADGREVMQRSVQRQGRRVDVWEMSFRRERLLARCWGGCVGEAMRKRREKGWKEDNRRGLGL